MKQTKLYLNLLRFLPITALLFTQAGCAKEDVFPSFTITSLESGEQIPHGTQILIIAEADDANRRILYVDFYINDIRIDRNNTFPYEYEWNTLDEETGINIIRATAVDADGQSASYEISVTITEGDPIVDFAAYPPSASLGSSTQFFSLSINNPVSWSWDFGDGNTSKSKNPNHTYSAEGTYTVSLTVTNSYGSDTKTIIDYFTVTIALTDYDGNVYQTVQIGDQLWMRENLKTTHYADGTSLLNGKGAGNIAGNYTTKYYFAPNNDESNVATYGRLYTWAAAMGGATSSETNPSGVQGVCPAGWHVPADDEWKELELHLGMDKWEVNSILWRGEAGAKLKDNSGNYWSQSIFNLIPENNESGFTALPARVKKNRTFSIFTTGFWSTTESINSHAWSRGLSSRKPSVHRSDDFKDSGYSVRCVKD